MSLNLWFRSPRYLLTLFLAIMLVLAASLSWLGWRLLKQDRALESQRIQERLDNAADLIAASLLHKFSESRVQFTSLVTLSDSDLAARASELPSQCPGTALLDIYGELEQMRATPVGGLPAELLARHARCTLLDELKRTTEVKREGGLLYANLHNGQWKLDRGAYRFYTQEASRWYTPDAEVQV